MEPGRTGSLGGYRMTAPSLHRKDIIYPSLHIHMALLIAYGCRTEHSRGEYLSLEGSKNVNK